MRRLLFQIHLWTGLILCVPLVALGLSGAVLVFHEEWDRAFAPGPAIVASGGAMRTYDEIAAAALARAPRGAGVRALTAPESPSDPATVRVGKGPRGGAVVHVDPATLAILHVEEAGPRGGVFQLAHDLHGRLLINGPVGRQIVGWFGVAMTALGLTGVVLWWPKRAQVKRAFTIAKNAAGYRFQRDLHGATGIWILVVFIIVSVTGVVISFPEPSTRLITALAPGRDLRASQQAIKVDPIKGATPILLEQAASLARQAAPDARLLSLTPPLRATDPLRVMMAPPGHRDRTPAVTVFIDPYRGRILEVRDPRAYSVGETIQAWQRALHEGSGFGIAWKLAVFISGLAPALFAITGATMWWMKRKARAGARQDTDADQARAIS